MEWILFGLITIILVLDSIFAYAVITHKFSDDIKVKSEKVKDSKNFKK